MAATLPSAKDLGVVGVQPGLGVATYRGATGNEGDAVRGTFIASQEVAAIGHRLDKAQEEFDAIQAEDRFNQYQEKLNQIANDPNTGWRTANGENAIKPEFVQKYSEQFEEERKRMTGTLDTANGKRRFGQLSATAAMRNRAALYEHSSKERVAYEAKVTSDSLKFTKENAWRSFGNDQLFEAEMARGRAITEAFASKWSVGASDESVKLAVQQFESSMWSARIQGALDSGDAQMAKELFGKASGSLTTDDKLKLDAKIKPQIRISKAVSAVDEIHGKLVGKDLNAPFPTREVDEAIRTRFADDPEMLRVARAESDYRRRAIDDAQRESNKANVGSVVQQLYEQRMPLSQVMRSPAYQALDGEQKARVIQQNESYMHTQEARRATAEGRALTAMQRQALAEERAGERALLQFKLNPEVVAKMDDNAVREFALTAGPKAAFDLMQYKKQLDKPEKVIAARMDAQTFKGIISEYGYKPELLTGRPKTDKDRGQQDELNNIYREVNQRIQAKANEIKRPLTREESEAIMRDALTQKVKLDYNWYELGKSDREVPAIAVPVTGERAAEMRARATVPMAEISPENLTATFQFIRSNRPGFERKTDAQIRAALQNEIERAAALARTGATADEVKAILRGAK